MSLEKPVKVRFETDGEMREFLRNIAMGVAHGDMKVDQGAVAIKACEVIVASHYSAAKIKALALAAAETTYADGALPLNGAKKLA